MEMDPAEGVQPISDFRKGSARILKRLRTARQPILLTQRGRSVAVLLDLETYERLEYAAHLRQGYRTAVRDMARGRTLSHEEVMRRARQRLRD